MGTPRTHLWTVVPPYVGIGLFLQTSPRMYPRGTCERVYVCGQRCIHLCVRVPTYRKGCTCRSLDWSPSRSSPVSTSDPGRPEPPTSLSSESGRSRTHTRVLGLVVRRPFLRSRSSHLRPGEDSRVFPLNPGPPHVPSARSDVDGSSGPGLKKNRGSSPPGRGARDGGKELWGISRDRLNFIQIR